MTPIELFKALADPTRLACMLALHQCGELCVCDLQALLAVSQPKMSRHLAQLRKAKLLILRKKGLWVYYQLNPHTPAWAFQIIQQASLASPAPQIPTACGANTIC